MVFLFNHLCPVLIVTKTIEEEKKTYTDTIIK